LKTKSINGVIATDIDEDVQTKDLIQVHITSRTTCTNIDIFIYIYILV